MQVLARALGPLLLLPLLSLPAAALGGEDPMPSSPQERNVLGGIPLHFEENRGQVGEGVDFLARGAGYTAFLRGGEIRLATRTREAGVHLLAVRFRGSNPEPLCTAEDELPGRTSYLRGSDPAAWITDVPNYRRVRYRDIYPGIDLLVYGQGPRVEYDLVLSPGTDPAVIAMEIEGGLDTRLDPDGAIAVETGDGVIRLRAPVVYEQRAGGRHPLPGRYVERGDGALGFEVDDRSPGGGLVIDPVIEYSTYLGASATEEGFDIAVDSGGNAYVTGFTSSSSFPTTPGAFDEVGRVGGFFDPGDAFVTKIDSTGSTLVYSTYLSGAGLDIGYSIDVDDAGCAYVVGSTDSVDDPGTVSVNEGFPLQSPLQPTYGGNIDLFVAKLNAAGTALVYSTYLGGTDEDRGCGEQDRPGVAVDASGHAYVGGTTHSTDFPTTPGAFLTAGPGLFVSKLATDGTTFEYSTHVGGNEVVFAQDLVVDGAGRAAIIGFTGNANLPTTVGSVQPVKATDEDGFVMQLNPAGSDLAFGTYFGGNACEFIYGAAIDSDGDLYITGQSSSTDYPTTSGSGVSANGSGVLTKIDATGSSIIWSKVIGADIGNGVAVDLAKRVSVTGEAFAAPSDVYFALVNSSGTFEEHETFWGGLSRDVGNAVTVDRFGHAYVTGVTASSSFPGDVVLNPNPFDGTLSGPPDAFIVKHLRDDPLPTGAPVVALPDLGAGSLASPNPFRAGTTISFDLPARSRVRLTLYDAAGREAEQLVDGVLGSGDQRVAWDARAFAAGVYFYVLQASPQDGTPPVRRSGRLVLLR